MKNMMQELDMKEMAKYNGGINIIPEKPRAPGFPRFPGLPDKPDQIDVTTVR